MTVVELPLPRIDANTQPAWIVVYCQETGASAIAEAVGPGVFECRECGRLVRGSW